MMIGCILIILTNCKNKTVKLDGHKVNSLRVRVEYANFDSIKILKFI